MTSDSATRQWLIVLGLGLGPAVSNGLARFAYGLVLPAMRDDLGWSYTEAGWIGTANAIGYLAGALLALRAIRRVCPGHLFLSGMLLMVLSMLFTAFTRDIWFVTAWRTIAGIGGAFSFISGGTMVSALFKDHPSKSALAIGIYFGGAGLGLLFCGSVIPLLLQSWGNAAWPEIWLLLAFVSAIAFVPSWASVTALDLPPVRTQLAAQSALPIRAMLAEMIGYFCFGVGYIVYMTFVVAWMQTQNIDDTSIAITWGLLGLSVMASPFLWRPLIAASSGGEPLALSCASTGLATLLPLFFMGPGGLFLSAALFGLGILNSASAVTSFGQKNLDAAHWGTAVALFTIIFAIGQIVGPVAAGVISDYSDSITLGMACAGAIQLFGALVAAIQKPLERSEGDAGALTKKANA